jgi:hypothetical protein
LNKLEADALWKVRSRSKMSRGVLCANAWILEVQLWADCN